MPDCSHHSLQFGHTSRPCCRASMVSTSSILDEKLHPKYGMETRFASVTHSQKSAGRDEPLTTDIGRITRIKIKDYGVIPCVVPAIVTEPTFCSRNFFPVCTRPCPSACHINKHKNNVDYVLTSGEYSYHAKMHTKDVKNTRILVIMRSKVDQPPAAFDGAPKTSFTLSK